MSDLQCPATFWLVAVDADEAAEAPEASDAAEASRADDVADVAEASRGDGSAVRERLRSARCAGVYAGPDVEPAAAALAGELGLPLAVADDLAGRRDGEDEPAALRRWRAGLEDVADLYRGESVLVVGAVGTLTAAVPGLAAGRDAAGRDAAGTPRGLLGRVDVDGDGWRVTGRP